MDEKLRIGDWSIADFLIMKFAIGKKRRMTHVFDETGKVHPATVLSASPLTVTQVKTDSTDGYRALQVGFGRRKAKRISKPVQGHIKNLGPFEGLREVRLSPEEDPSAFQVGSTIDISVFSPGEKVELSGTSKGKGFQGVVKRYGFAGGSRTHGQKHSEREPGSIGGAGRAGGRVVKGMRMAGRMGGDRVTLKNVLVLQVDPAAHEIIVRGAVPGRPGSIVEILGR